MRLLQNKCGSFTGFILCKLYSVDLFWWVVYVCVYVCVCGPVKVSSVLLPDTGFIIFL